MEVLPVIPKRFKFARGVTWLFLVLPMLVLVYIYFRAHYQGITTLHDFLNHSLLKYSVISLAGIIFWGVVLRLKDEIKLNIVIVTTSLIVGCYLIEITLGFLAPFESGQDDPSYNKKGVEYDTRNKLEVWLDLKSKGMDVLPWVSPMTNFTPSNGIPGVVPPPISSFQCF